MTAARALLPAAALVDGRIIVAGERIETEDSYELLDPFSGELTATIHTAGPDHVKDALAAARTAQIELARMPVHERAALLRRVASLVAERAPELAATIPRQTGKAIKDATREVGRSPMTIDGAASAAELLGVALPPADAIASGAGLLSFAVREPLGVIAAVTPFNAPFNLVMHKVAPAIAAGNAVVVKPAPQAPLCALQIADLFLEAGLPRGAISVLPGGPEMAGALVSDPAVDAISFTGGVSAATAIGRSAPLKKLLFELGGNSPNIVADDADLENAVSQLTSGGFGNTGQSCNSVQRIIAHRSIVDELGDRLAAAASALRTGDPLDPTTDVGSLVNAAAAERVESWIQEAARAGAVVRAGGTRDGAILRPTVISGVQPDMRVACEEIFGPVVVLISFDTVDDAIEIANATEFGLQGAVFTRSLATAMRCIQEVNVGTVLVNRSSNFRLDHYPFGGRKNSGSTREGGVFTVEAMSQIKLGILDIGA